MTNHGFIDPDEPLRRRIEDLEAQVLALTEADRRPGYDSGEYYEFTRDELAEHDLREWERIARAIETRNARVYSGTPYGNAYQDGFDDALAIAAQIARDGGAP